MTKLSLKIFQTSEIQEKFKEVAVPLKDLNSVRYINDKQCLRTQPRSKFAAPKTLRGIFVSSAIKASKAGIIRSATQTTLSSFFSPLSVPPHKRSMIVESASQT